MSALARRGSSRKMVRHISCPVAFRLRKRSQIMRTWTGVALLSCRRLRFRKQSKAEQVAGAGLMKPAIFIIGLSLLIMSASEPSALAKDPPTSAEQLRAEAESA